MITPVFVYATLKARGIQKEALGRAVRRTVPAVLPGYAERPISYEHQSWPTLWKAPFIRQVQGEVLMVNDRDLKKLDNWESNYRRVQVMTSIGKAWAFVFAKQTSVSRGTPV